METVLTADILRAFEMLGGEAYLRANPDVLAQVLLSINNTPLPEVMEIICLRKEVPWIDFGNRLSYKRGDPRPSNEVIEDIASRPTSWKPEPDTAENRLKADIKKLSELE
jgi:hypothetical protein